MWYADHINETFKIKKEHSTYYELFYKQRIVFKDDALLRAVKTNYNNLQQTA